MTDKKDTDVFYTIPKVGEGQYREKMSRFLAFAIPVKSADEAKTIVKEYQNKYCDSRHVCWAYALGPRGEEWQLNDNGEPSGTAGKPILGQIRSFGLTDVVVLVVRYFGGIKLGTSGLITAYKEAARLALEDAGKIECYEMEPMAIEFSYVSADGVMKLIKSLDIEVISRQFDNVCEMMINVRKSKIDEIRGRLSSLGGVTVDPK